MFGPICQKADDRSRHNLAHGQTTGRGIGPKLPYNVGRDLERDRDGRLDPWHAVPDRLELRGDSDTPGVARVRNRPTTPWLSPPCWCRARAIDGQRSVARLSGCWWLAACDIHMLLL